MKEMLIHKNSATLFIDDFPGHFWWICH